MSPKNPIALITGASAGIGLEMAKVLAEKKHDLILVARREDRLKKLADELHAKHDVHVHVLAHDLSQPGSAQTLYDKIRTDHHRIDVLINNAGFGVIGEFVSSRLDRTEEMLQLNISALTSLTHLVAANMRESKRGRILLVSSIGAYQPCPFFAAYAASKAYVLSFGLALHEELKKEGITVTTLCPGNTSTEFMDVAGVSKNPVTTTGAMSAAAVAKEGIDALFRATPHITTGIANKINGALVMHLPRTFAAKIAGAISKKFLNPHA